MFAQLKKVKFYCSCLLLVILWATSATVFASKTVIVRGLFKGGAILEVDGKQAMVRAGKFGPGGVKLIEADTSSAIVEIDGERKTLYLNKQIGTQFREPEKTEVRIASGMGGHFFTPGRINGRPVKFLVDTGATSIALSSETADSLAIDYKDGVPMGVNTANGFARGYRITLQHVSVGDLRVNNVEAMVIEGQFPLEILLGNTYLSRVNFKIENGVLVLESKY